MSDTIYLDQSEMTITINKDRSISVPEILEKSIVQRDHNIESIPFNCPRYWYGNDISTMAIYVVFDSENESATEEKPLRDVCSKVEVDADDPNMLHFVWTVTKNASKHTGKLAWKVCAIATDDAGNETIHWNSHMCRAMEVQEGMEADDYVPEQYPDEYSHLVQRVNALEQELGMQMEAVASLLGGAS